MKRFKIIYLITAAVAGLLVSCNTEEVTEKGNPEGEQVYFPSNAASSYTIEEGTSSVSVPVRRGVAGNEYTVNILADLSSLSDADQSVFDIPSSVTFTAGEKEAELVISYDSDRIEDGKEYRIGFLLNDADNISPYGNSSMYITLASWPWELLGTGKYRDDVFSAYGNPTVEVNVNIHKRKSGEDIFMIEEMFGWPFLTAFFGASEEELSEQFSYTPTNVVIDCTNPNAVVIEEQSTGVSENVNGYGEHIFGSDQPGTYADGIITFPTKGLYLGMVGTGEAYYANTNGMFRITMPGVEILDYSLSASYAGMRVASDNETAYAVIDFSYGADVTGISYVFVSGDRSADLETIAASVADGTAENIYTVEGFIAGGETATVQASLPSGSYTIVAVPNDSNGALSAANAVCSVFYFPGMDGGTIPDCDVNVTLYTPSEFDPESTAKYPDYSSLAFEITGSEISSLRYYLNTTELIESVDEMGMTLQQVIDQYGSDFSASDMAELNESGSIGGFFSKLNPSTSYTMVISAKNTYSKTALVTSDPKSTAAIPYSGDLVIGKYTITCQPQGASKPFENTFELQPTLGSDTEFLVKDLGINNNARWYATYDPSQNKVTLSGLEYGYEEYGNQFGVTYGYFDAAKTQAYGLYSYASDSSTGTDPCVFSVDPGTRQLAALDTELIVPVFDIASEELLGYAGYFEAGTAAVLASSGSSAATMIAGISGVGQANYPGLQIIRHDGFQMLRNTMEPSMMSHTGSGPAATLKVETTRCEPLEKSLRVRGEGMLSVRFMK